MVIVNDLFKIQAMVNFYGSQQIGSSTGKVSQQRDRDTLGPIPQ
jgi:hypothetical protein